MISLTRLNGVTFWLNPDQIVTVEATPDTVLALKSGEKWVVQESPAVVCERILHYRQQVAVGPLNCVDLPLSSSG
ncbi:MAG: flagellar FlbD family protein [Vampirovibrionales bacterium]|nr:flagellar FlbD family protein [Vampirovibrionales bacterium]